MKKIIFLGILLSIGLSCLAEGPESYTSEPTDIDTADVGKNEGNNRRQTNQPTLPDTDVQTESQGVGGESPGSGNDGNFNVTEGYSATIGDPNENQTNGDKYDLIIKQLDEQIEKLREQKERAI